MADQGPQRGDQDNRWARHSKTIAGWVLVVLFSILIISFLQGREEAKAQFTYTELLQQLQNGNILNVTIFEGRRVEGELAAPVSREQQDLTHFEVILPVENDPYLMEQLRTHNVTIDGDREQTGLWQFLLTALPWLLFIAFWIWIFRTMQSGGNRAFQFGRSKAKLISPDTPKVTFNDVAGADEAKEELQEIIEFLKEPQKFQKLGGRIPKGVLLMGSPGTGKTLLARAVAGEAPTPTTISTVSYTHLTLPTILLV